MAGRREVLAGFAGALAMGVCTGRSSHAGDGVTKFKKTIAFENAEFYDKQKQFRVEKAKDAVVALMKYHGYPAFPGIKDKLWVSDYGKGEFTKFGLAAIMFMNNEKDQYMLMDIFLLPGQMLPEHWHLKTEKNPPKREGWLVRAGLSHIVGIGADNLGKDVIIPACHSGGKTETRHETIATPGMFVPLAEVETKHWQWAGPEGAIITEVANVHDNAGVRHSDKEANDFFLSGK
jgi:D-lyxose ketol-isomerase